MKAKRRSTGVSLKTGIFSAHATKHGLSTSCSCYDDDLVVLSPHTGTRNRLLHRHEAL